MKTYHKNPRRITDKQVDKLRDSLADLGDLGGIVHDLNTDEIIGGNQRSGVFNINHCEIELTHEADEPDEQGTVGLGYVIWKGKRYAYRQVRWTPEQCEEANIKANKLGGGWDFDILADQFEFDDLLEWGFEPFELGMDDTSGEEWGEAFDGVPDGEREPFQQMTFTLHDTQVEQVKAAMATAARMGDFDGPNENSNGNALSRVCETFLTAYGDG